MKPILQVDYDPNDAFFLQHAMRKAGIPNPLRVATNGREAIDYLQGAGQFGDRTKYPFPCLVLMDLRLPCVMGLDVLRWIRQQLGTGLMVIVLTASRSEADIAEAYRLGANGFLAKPSEASKFEEMVKAIRDFWLNYNTLPKQSSPVSAVEPAVRRVPSPTTAFAARHRPRVNGAHRQKPPLNTKGNI
jgi:CheY-like chemotaxis protein